LQTAVVTTEASPYSDALHCPAIVMHDDFPEKSASLGEIRTYNTLKTRDLSSGSFPKTLLLGRVGYASCFLSIAPLP
jgi:hypothetical protein